jgi:hypothetical protein
MFGLPKEAAGAIFAALIAGLVSLLGLIISKEQKISEFRQAWIDGLRENIALVITHLEAIRGAMYAAQPGKPPWQDRKEHFVAINQAITCVRLRLNPDEDSSQKLLESLTELETIAQAGDIATSTLVGPAVDKLTACCNVVMKEEWKRVQDGEKTYRVARYGSIAAVAIALVLLFGIVIRSLVYPNTSETPPPDKTAAQKFAPPAEIKIFATPCVETPTTPPSGRAALRGKTPRAPAATPSKSPCVQITSDGASIQVFNSTPAPPK